MVAMGLVAEDRPVYQQDEEAIEHLAELVRQGSNNEKEIARLGFVLNRTYTWREIHAMLKERGAHPHSYSWLFRLGKIWSWWVVRNSYDPDYIFTLPRNKLYMMAAAKSADLDFLLARLDMTDSNFAQELRAQVGDVVHLINVRISREVYEGAVQEIIKRIMDLTGHNLSPAAALEFAAEVVARMPDASLLFAWQAAHGELGPEGLSPDDIEFTIRIPKPVA